MYRSSWLKCARLMATFGLAIENNHVLATLGLLNLKVAFRTLIHRLIHLLTHNEYLLRNSWRITNSTTRGY
ncbi:hypothetical protein DFR44_12421 [Hydromonas duriensis]|uniref:Uncharacterized protein n=1 Tax=Hydromonas duriensis TaxID=1527608 RepID=A0A4R6Y1Z4_9BURK|nr:hypothetical protein DFR44_12421 [Hydromonas duriensis]